MSNEAFTPVRAEMKGGKPKGSATRKYFIGDEYCLAEALYQTFKTPFPRLRPQSRLLLGNEGKNMIWGRRFLGREMTFPVLSSSRDFLHTEFSSFFWRDSYGMTARLRPHFSKVLIANHLH